MTTIDKPKAIELLKEAASQSPDFVYREWFPMCEYVLNEDAVREEHKDNGEQPPQFCCIVGKVALLAGADEETLGTISGSIEDEHNTFEELLGLDFTGPAIEVLQTAQNWQDSWDVTWSEAVKLAEAGIGVLYFTNGTELEQRDDRDAVLAITGRAVLRLY